MMVYPGAPVQASSLAQIAGTTSEHSVCLQRETHGVTDLVCFFPGICYMQPQRCPSPNHTQYYIRFLQNSPFSSQSSSVWSSTPESFFVPSLNKAPSPSVSSSHTANVCSCLPSKCSAALAWAASLTSIQGAATTPFPVNSEIPIPSSSFLGLSP